MAEPRDPELVAPRREPGQAEEAEPVRLGDTLDGAVAKDQRGSGVHRRALLVAHATFDRPHLLAGRRKRTQEERQPDRHRTSLHPPPRSRSPTVLAVRRRPPLCCAPPPLARHFPLAMDMQITELLAQVPLFHELEPSELEMIAATTRSESYAAGQDIVRIGDAGHSLYVVVEGRVVVLFPARSSDVELARLEAGKFFGEMAILNAKPRSATVRALEDVRVLVLEKEDCSRTLARAPEIALKLLCALSARIRNTDEQLSGLSERSLRDDLTGLLNRRSFHDRLAEECDRGRRYGDAFALVLLDIDHFKKVNDTFGHDVGDAALAWIGRLLEEHTHTADIPFRIGGEEFAVICPEIGVTEAGIAARRLVEVVAEARPATSFPLHVTVSAGFAVCPVHGKRSDQIFQAADHALLRSKADGRNRVTPAALVG